jgi:hypothetical protein
MEVSRLPVTPRQRMHASAMWCYVPKMLLCEETSFTRHACSPAGMSAGEVGAVESFAQILLGASPRGERNAGVSASPRAGHASPAILGGPSFCLMHSSAQESNEVAKLGPTPSVVVRRVHRTDAPAHAIPPVSKRSKRLPLW